MHAISTCLSKFCVHISMVLFAFCHCWQVLAKICVATRPALNLAEVMSREQLEWLVLLAVHHEHSQGPMLWGGPWASHAITCLLQDILEGLFGNFFVPKLGIN